MNRISNRICEAIGEFLFQRLGEKVSSLDVKLLYHYRGTTLRLITINQSDGAEHVRTYELELKLMDEEIRSVN